MKLRELIKDISPCEVYADTEMEIKGVSCGSGSIKEEELFVAIKGFNSDGHSFISQAAARGAVCIICQSKPAEQIPYVIVEDTRKAMALICAAWFGHPAKKMKLIGVTGTNGKTTVTHLIKHIIENTTGENVGLIGTIANYIAQKRTETSLTTPDSYKLQQLFADMVDADCKYAVMEVSSHALSLHRVYGIDYDTGIFTNLTPEHLDFHNSMDEYAQAKAILFAGSRISILNLDDKYSDVMSANSRGSVLTYAIDNTSADLVGKNIKFNRNKTEFDVCCNGSTAHVKLQIPGIFSVYNALAALATCVSQDITLKEAAEVLGSCKGVNGRAEVLETQEDYTIIIDYAHTPDALINIIKATRATTTGKIHTLFGCGGDRDKTKRPVMGKAAADLSDFIIVTSDNPRTEEPAMIIEDILLGIENVQELQENGKLKVLENRREAIHCALDYMKKDDVLIIAGKGHETYQITGKEKIHFDDREVVFEKLKNKNNGVE